ncbi:MAG: DUF1549 domain-containing protein [Pirellulaceae bacterium]
MVKFFGKISGVVSLVLISGAAVAQDSDHWAFNPVSRPAIPELTNDQWSLTPIDKFISRTHHQLDLSPSDMAQRGTLIRRLYMDLLGLPPSREAVEQFTSDDSPDAWSRLVDKVLASPHYGERWGRHWLDLARYADSNGFEFDFVRPYAWHYRDWVIRSLNIDKPYDEFVREQIAGDEINRADFESWVATGFCRNGPTVGNQTLEKNKYDELHDVISSVSEVFLGLTIGCARCHDHKFDPISQKDYYRMLAIFHTTGKRQHLIGTPEQTAAYKTLKAREKELNEQLKQLTNQASRGDWQINDGQLIQSAFTNNARIWFGDQQWSDYTLEVEFKKTKGTTESFSFNAGVYVSLRAKDYQSGYTVHLGASDNREHGIAYEQNGGIIPLAPRVAGSIHVNQWHKLKASVRGDRVQFWLDGELLFDLHDTHSTTGGISFGNWSCETQWKNLTIKRVDGELLLHSFVPITDCIEPEFRQADINSDVIKREISQIKRDLAGLPLAMSITDDSSTPRETHIHIRGDFKNEGELVSPGPPQVLEPIAIDFPEAKEGDSTTGRRRVFAHWITDKQNPLTARVMVNRIWQFHFGKGLVETPSNFGLTGFSSSHPQLLDWLAAEFVDHNWSIKHIHQLILNSATYKQSSNSRTRSEKANRVLDPHAVFLTRYPKRRHDAEVIRDRILSASGAINLQMYGQGIHPRISESIIGTSTTRKWPTVEVEGPEHWRRSVYIFVRRSVLFPLLESLDAPVTTQSCERRMITIVPTQALQLLNNPFSNDQAYVMALDVVTSQRESIRDQVIEVYWRALSRHPDESEIRDCMDFVNLAIQLHKSQRNSDLENDQHEHEIRVRALSDLCHTMFNLNEFAYHE